MEGIPSPVVLKKITTSYPSNPWSVKTSLSSVFTKSMFTAEPLACRAWIAVGTESRRKLTVAVYTNALAISPRAGVVQVDKSVRKSKVIRWQAVVGIILLHSVRFRAFYAADSQSLLEFLYGFTSFRGELWYIR